MFCAPMLGSPWLPHNRYVRLDTVLDPGWSNTPCPFYSAPCLLLPAGVQKPSAPSNAVISGLHPSQSALSVTIAPRLLSCLRIKQPIAGLPARLDTWPGASSYQGGIHTRSIVRHCQAATATCPHVCVPMFAPNMAIEVGCRNIKINSPIFWIQHLSFNMLYYK